MQNGFVGRDVRFHCPLGPECGYGFRGTVSGGPRAPAVTDGESSMIPSTSDVMWAGLPLFVGRTQAGQ